MNNTETITLADKLNVVTENFANSVDPQYVQAFEDFIYVLKKSGVENSALKVGDTAPGFELKNALGRRVSLSDALKNGPVILTWYRGGWCPYCNLALHELQTFLQQFKSAGASLIALSPERPDKSLTLQEKHHLEFEVLTDLDNKIAKKYGGVHALSTEVRDYYNSKKVFEFYPSELYEFPIPATYIIDQNYKVRYAFVDADFRKRAEPSDILHALRAIDGSTH